ncbi:MAG: DUF2341 domain-containing protein, partial [Candidatus Peribacteraceae bacterium]|nr:DUF2341 domain-containing protein [Candidatus Peribacteraceae bacterium]
MHGSGFLRQSAIHFSPYAHGRFFLSAFLIFLFVLAPLAPLLHPPFVERQQAHAFAELSGFAYRKRIVIDNTNVDSNLSNFPLYVKVNADADVGAAAQADGDDIRFATATGMVLPYEEESFLISSGSGSGNYWVKVPTVLTATGTVIYLYYGSGSAVDGQNATGVWDSNYKGVWHLKESVAGYPTEGDVIDSTGNNNDGTGWSASPDMTPDPVDAKLSRGQLFDGTNDSLYVADSASLSQTGTMTLSTWYKLTSAAADYDFLTGKMTNGNWTDGYGLFFTDDFSGNTVVFHAQGWNVNRAYVTFDWTSNTSWHYVVGRYDGSNVKINLDASAGTSDAYSGSISDTATYFTMGAGQYSDGASVDYYPPITLDEVRISAVARSDAWVKFEYYNINESDQEVSWAAEESANSAPTITSVTDSPDPVDEGEDVTFSVDWNDADAEGIKMYVCKAADGTSAGCGAGGTWCSASGSYALTDPITCAYTATSAAAGTQNYYAYVCDDSAACSSASSGTFSVTAWLSGFTKRKRIVIDNTNVDSNLSNFPLYVKVNADAGVGAAAQADGDDIRFATATGMVLPYEEESFLISSGSGSGNYWVKVPTVLTATGTVIYLYYGSGSAVDGQNVTGVWDANYDGVWHLNETSGSTAY